MRSLQCLLRLRFGILGTQAITNDDTSLDDLFKPDGSEAINKPTPPPETESLAAPKENGHPPGWRIRDYYLDDKNASNWDQIRTAWTGNNGSNFVFNNRININPQGTVDTPVTVPPIRFMNGMTMPMLPTIAAPTNMPQHGFPNDDDDDEEDEDDFDKQQQQLERKPQQQNPQSPPPSYGLEYPWQWHNRRPQGSRYHNQHLHFHGKPTPPAFRPVAVTTRRPQTVGTEYVVTKPSVALEKDNGHSNDSQVGTNGGTQEKGTDSQPAEAGEQKAQNEKVAEDGGQKVTDHNEGKNIS